MKIYNISDTQKFFNQIASCEGTVEILNGQGVLMTLQTADDKEKISLLAQTYTSGTLNGIEVKLHDPRDNDRMCRYLMEAA
ncbi:MAG: hypothetical protein IJR00_02490 [Lachnospiraceae bacterium]|nr:hypothetical protein [Lachnospiraceae bacterium]